MGKKEELLIPILGWIPFGLGVQLRRVAYRLLLFEQLGDSVQIMPNVLFAGTDQIKLGDGVKIQSGARIRLWFNKWTGTRIHLQDGVSLDFGVDIRTHSPHGGDIHIGERTVLGPYTCISGNPITIGRDCLIASNVGMYANNHTFSDLSKPISQQGHTYKGISIGDDCWLGTGVKVLDGVTIGHGCVIGAGSVVTKSLPDYSIAVGVPAKVIGNRKNNAEKAEENALSEK